MIICADSTDRLLEASMCSVVSKLHQRFGKSGSPHCRSLHYLKSATGYCASIAARRVYSLRSVTLAACFLLRAVKRWGYVDRARVVAKRTAI